MITFKNGKYHINNGLCQQCGSCYAICPKQAISYIRRPETGLLHFDIVHKECINCGLCEKHCPANKSTYLPDIDSYCQNKTYYLGSHKNENIRKAASSGGIARGIIVEGLKSGLFDGVYTLKRIDTYPYAEGEFYTPLNLPSYHDIPNSLYHSVPLNLQLHKIQKCKRLLIVGTPCQLRSLSTIVKSKCEELIQLAIFCKQQKTFQSTRFIAKLAKTKLEDTSQPVTLSYRGNGWPGYCTFNDRCVPWGTAAQLPFGKKLWTVPGCDICGNPFGNDVNLTLMDPWVIKKKNDMGDTVIIVHDKQGADILAALQPYIRTDLLNFQQIEPALMCHDIIRKNKYLNYFKGQEVNPEIIRGGNAFRKRRKRLEHFLLSAPRFPLIVYKILGRIIKDIE